jgi:glycolate oxidase
MTVLDRLKDAVGAKGFSTDPNEIAPHLEEWRGKYHGHSSLLLKPASTVEVSSILRICNENATALVTQGGNTGLVGGQIPLHGEVLLSTQRLNKVRGLDQDGMTLTVEAGVTLAEVQHAADEKNLLFPLSLASEGSCTIGGNIATNAGGTHVLRYGMTRALVLGLEAVLPNGTVLDMLRALHKDNSGYDLKQLFIGSEGTLGVITEVTLRLLPAQPPMSTLVASFATVQDAADAVLAIVATVRPSTLELMDNTAINAVEDMVKMGLDRSTQALLLARSDAPGGAAAHEVTVMAEACRKSGAVECFTTDDPDDGEAFAAARRSAFTALERKGDLLLEDVGVALPKLPALVAGVEAIAAEHRTVIAVVAHAGDGNTHPLIVFDAADPDSSHRAHLAFAAIMDLAISLGGTITGEHGVGRLKKAWLPAYLGPEALALTQRIKDALDPAGILNPGALL